MFSGVEVSCKKLWAAKPNTFHQSMTLSTIGSSHVSRCRPPDWGLRDYRNRRLETLNDMAQHRLQ